MALIAATGIAGDEVRSNDKPVLTDSATNSVNVEVERAAEQNAAADYKQYMSGEGLMRHMTPSQLKVEPIEVAQNGVAPRGGTGFDCEIAIDLGDLTMGPVTVMGDSSFSTYVVDETVNTELPGTSCGGAFTTYAGSTGLWYTFTGTGNTVNLSTCAAGTTFDTTIAVFCGDCDPGAGGLFCAGGDGDAGDVACPDIPAGGIADDGFLSIADVCTTMGETYYVLIHGFGAGDAGAFELTVTDDGTPCTGAALCAPLPPFMCDVDATAEVEPCRTSDTDMDQNDGCAGDDPLMPEFETLNLGDKICGNRSGYVSASAGTTTNDLDWYELVLGTETQVTFNFDTEDDSVFGFLTDSTSSAQTFPMDGCSNANLVVSEIEAGGGIAFAAGTSNTMTACLPAGTYVLIVNGQAFIADIECPDPTQYQIEVVDDGACPEAACCLGDGSCATLSFAACATAGGTVFDMFADCASLAAADLTGLGGGVACYGFCCAGDGMLNAVDGTAGGSADDCADDIAMGAATSFEGYNLTPAEASAITCPVIPDNVSCDLAELVPTDGTSVFGSTIGSPFIVDGTGIPGSACGTAYTGVPGTWFTFTGTGTDMFIDTCLPGTDFSTDLSVFCGDCVSGLFCVGGNGVGAGAACGVEAQTTVGTVMGETYYILMFGFSTTGNFELQVTDTMVASVDPVLCMTCPVPCPMGGLPEALDGDCMAPPTAEGNDGCDADGAAGIPSNTELISLDVDLGQVFCGTIGARDVDGTATADNDWWVVSNPTSAAINVTISVESEAAASWAVFNYDAMYDPTMGADCDQISGLLVPVQTVGNCLGAVTADICLPPGDWFFNIIGDTTSDACVNDAYTLTISQIGDGVCSTGSCCLGDGTCTDGELQSDCLAAGGVYTDMETCADNMAMPGSTTCLGACCILAEIPGDPNTCIDTDFDTCTTDPNFTVWNGIETACADMDVDCGTRPANDECDGAAVVMTDGTPVTSDTNGTTDGQVWFSFTGTGNEVLISTCGSTMLDDMMMAVDIDTTMNVYCNDCDELRSLAFSDDLGTCSPMSEITICTDLGVDYLISVQPFGGDLGMIEVIITDDPGMTGPCMDIPDCSPSGACCLDEVTSDCVISTQIECEGILSGTFAGADTICGGPGYDIAVANAVAFNDIRLTGTAVVFTATGTFAADDEGVATITLPFGFDFFGDTIAPGTDLFINTNGFATFDDLLTLYPGVNFFTNDPIPSASTPQGVIAPQWDDQDLTGDPDNGCWTLLSDPDMTPGTGDESLTIQWDCSIFGTPANILFQAIINADGSIVFHYSPDSSGFTGSTSFGIENLAGDIGVSIFDQGLVTVMTGDEITFTINDVPETCPAALGTLCSADFDGDFDVDLTDFGTFGAAFGSNIVDMDPTNDANYNPAADFDSDGDVDLTDFGTFGAQFGNVAADCDPALQP